MSPYRWPTRRPPDEEDAGAPSSTAREAPRRSATPDERRAQDDERTAMVKTRAEAEATATDEKTARLRALRLARDQGKG